MRNLQKQLCFQMGVSLEDRLGGSLALQPPGEATLGIIQQMLQSLPGAGVVDGVFTVMHFTCTQLPPYQG